MRTIIGVSLGMLVIVHGGLVDAAPEKAAQPVRSQTAQPPSVQPAMDPAKQAAMEAMQKAGSPSEGHKALEPFVGTWAYTAQWRMAPDAQPEAMSGSAHNSLVFGDRFLKQEIRGQGEGQPPFEGLGFTGYDNLRKEYQTVWFDSMATGMMRGTGQFDPATKTLTDQGDFSCPLTMETHRPFRAVWKVIDPQHTVYETYMRTPDGVEFKAMEIHYTRT
jgi:hypothetical protein